MMSYEGEEEDKEEEMANLEDPPEENGNSEKERLRKDSDGDSLLGSDNGNHDPSYEDVLLDEEHTKSKGTNNFTELETQNGEIPVADPTGSSFFFATYPRLIEYKSTYDRARELVILNQNKIFLSMVIAVTVLGLLGILIYFSVKTWNVEDDSLIIDTLDGSLILLD